MLFAQRDASVEQEVDVELNLVRRLTQRVAAFEHLDVVGASTLQAVVFANADAYDVTTSTSDIRG